MAVGSLLGAAVIGGVAKGLSGSGTGKAQQALDAGSAQAAQVQRDIYNNNVQLLTPNLDRGNWAGNALSGILGLHSDQSQNQAAQDKFKQYIQGSDYAFQFGEGANALNSQYAGAGALKSGAAMRDLEQYRQNLQSGYRTQYMNALAGQEGAGLTAGGALAGVGTNYANSLGNIYQQQGENRANAALAGAQNRNNLIGSVVSGVGMLGGLFG